MATGDAVIARELTKRFEEIRRGSLSELALHYTRSGPPKGEIVVVVAPAGDAPPPAEDSIDALLRETLPGRTLRDAVDLVAGKLELPRRAVYERALAIRPSQVSDRTDKRRGLALRPRCGGDFASRTLRLRGYRIVGRRLRYPVGEIDIVARRGQTLAVIEVKARRNLKDAAEAVSRKQQNRITRATEWLLSERPRLGSLQPRFDVMLVAPWRRPRHLGDAWRQEHA